MMNPASFWSFMADKYARDPIADEDSYQHKLAKSREYFSKDSKVLEIGSGTGSTALLHAPYVKTILATDISERMIEISNEKLAGSDIENVTFKLSSIDDLDIEDESLDIVLGLSILHLLEDRQQTVTQVYKMLKHGGVFITSTVCLGDNMKYLKYFAPIGRLFGLMLKVFSKKQLEQDFVNAGFKIDYIWKPEKGDGTFMVAKKP